MDSMRSLNKSLPSSNANRPPPPEQLLQAFRTAALSVTNLYKSAVNDQSHSRQEGYQDALDDLLVFLDREYLGLQDGEGWRVRQWITERHERTSVGAPQNDSDDEQPEPERQPRSSSPTATRPQEPLPPTEQPTADIPATSGNLPPTINDTTEGPERPPAFTFTAGASAQSDIPMQVEEVPATSDPSNTAQAPVRVEMVGRGSRNSQRHVSPRHGTRGSNREFTFASGTKRKLQFPDFFDISNVGSSRDREGSGGGKRGRFA